MGKSKHSVSDGCSRLHGLLLVSNVQATKKWAITDVEANPASKLNLMKHMESSIKCIYGSLLKELRAMSLMEPESIFHVCDRVDDDGNHDNDDDDED